MDTISEICCECRTCEQSCPKKAITMHMNSEGFSYPQIDNRLCVNCGICQKVCPMLHHDQLKEENGKLYAAQIKESKKLKKSSSGGVFVLLATHVLAQNGLVCGAAYSDKLKVQHTIIDSIENLSALQGSKYVHSEIGHTYTAVKQALRQHRWVYFTGTPCQVAGLKIFLNSTDTSTLVTSDLLCHGTPSQLIFDRFVENIEKTHKGTVINWNFRDKSIAGWDILPSLSIQHPNTKKKLIYEPSMNAYFKAYLNGWLSREDCYKCPFACTRRVSDITLGDFWGIERTFPNFPNISKGVSLISVNTPKGMEIWNQVKAQTHHVECDIRQIYNTPNLQFIQPTARPTQRDSACVEALTNIDEFRRKTLQSNDKFWFYKSLVRKNLSQIDIFRKAIELIWKIKRKIQRH